MRVVAAPELTPEPGPALQGSLFGDPDPTPIAKDSSRGGARTGPNKPAAETLPEPSLQRDALLADAQARPRTRRPQTRSNTSVASDESEGGDDSEAANATDATDDALPPWHHHSLVDPEQLTPMLRHYVELKRAHPQRVLLYRLGDFFECFFEDAITLSRLLELTLTGKDAGKEIGRVPMAGIPHHAAERYCSDLVRRGLSVALCDQLEATASKGSLLRRDITRILTPGTVLEDGMLAARRNNWLCAVVLEGSRWGLAVADVSTGDFRVSEQDGHDRLHQELLQREAAEVLWPSAPGDQDAESRPSWCPEAQHLTRLARTPFETPEARATLLERFRLASLDGLGLGDAPLALRAAGGLVRYLDDTQPSPESDTSAGSDSASEAPQSRKQPLSRAAARLAAI
ncbi:MAG: mismatch repair protein MutS, partial [Cyanobacteriota bacterium]